MNIRGRSLVINNTKDIQLNFDQIQRQLKTLESMIKINNATTSDNNNSMSGTFTLDDGSNWRITMKFNKGKLVNISIGSPVSATATWV